MKTTFLAILMLAGLSGAAAPPEQTQQTDLLKDLSPAEAQKAQQAFEFQEKVMRQVLGLNVSYSGVLPMLARTDNPLQLINPAAPARYGNGFDNVTIDPVTRRADGIAFFRINF
jgi:hypothetical protein